METRGLVASWDRWSDRLELVISGQGVHEVRLFYSRYFGIPEDRIRVVMGDVGGSFGQKVFPVNDEIAVVAAARKLGRPVKWIEDRSENLIAGGVVQGIGGVFYEHMIYDPEGNPLPTTFLDYQLPTAAEVPELEYGHVVTPGSTPGGYKGMGEGGAIAGPFPATAASRPAGRG